MKKIYSISLAVLFSGAVMAQKTVHLGVNLTSPAVGSTLTVGGPSFVENVIITVLGPQGIAPADTFYYVDPTLSSGYYYRLNLTKNVNDTILINKTLTITSSSSIGTVNYCIGAFASNGATIIPLDTVYSKCNSVNIVGGTGIGELTFTEKVDVQKISIHPNPAQNEIFFDYKAQGNSELIAHILDITGREVMSHSYGKVFPGKTGFALDVSALITGIYFVELREEGVRAVGKLQKQ